MGGVPWGYILRRCIIGLSGLWLSGSLFLAHSEAGLLRLRFGRRGLLFQAGEFSLGLIPGFSHRFQLGA